MMSDGVEDTQEFGRDDCLQTVVSMLESGDSVLINDRSIPLEVFDTDTEKIGANAHPTETVYLEGRAGRVYKIRGEYGPDRDTKTSRPPLLQLRKEDEWGSCRVISRIELTEGQQILSDTRAGEWSQEAGIDVR